LADVDLVERLGSISTIRVAPTPETPLTPRVLPRRSRAAERARRRSLIRRRVLFGLAGVGAVVTVVAVVVALTGGVVIPGRDGNDAPQRVTTGPVAQRTMLVQVTGVDGVATASALVGVGAQVHSVVLIPSGVLVEVPGTGTLPLGETTTLPEPSSPSQALTDLLGVRIDDSWVLTAQALAALVDAVGGVRATVDTDVVRTDADGGEVVVVRPGNQELRGSAAAAYATYLGDGEPEQARLARFDDVFTAVAGGLPQDSAAVAAVIEGLGDGSRSTLDAAGLADRLGMLRAATADESLVSDVLPVTEYDTGGGAATYGIDSGQVAAMMRARFPGALQTDRSGSVLRVLVENGVGTPGLVEQARSKLVTAGFRFVNGGNAADFTGEPSSVIIPDGTESRVRQGQRVAAALGLPASSIATSDRGQTVADVIVILGSDFAP